MDHAIISPGRGGHIFAENAPNLLAVILHRCGIEITFETVMGAYENQALDLHVNREWFREKWFE
ncbi:hypothetical protein EO98_19105 [Methanosarcina sp. 2.H.T.1A.6]|nr:hypothetical protein EO94_07240 [Methanosarcina sp. 2.H.T.1A.3]KKG16661.1 hypothetical protein EO97_00445 [Methanosarcina sp. 2.H.T.1A.15]KKG19370.1 hypothetical protein EO98_19105 [Methanosarcina sp. 2.H.T.1A.6]KKG25588.1 hypothetical protein EO96_18740 [Methanosarcina sp. 2.H.T.1A.8]